MKTENRQKLYAYLSEHPCVDCGVTDVRVLEFDHVRGNKSANIAGLLNNAVSWSTIEKEIAKCEVRCANCHRIKTNERGSWWRFGKVEKMKYATLSLKSPQIYRQPGAYL